MKNNLIIQELAKSLPCDQTKRLFHGRGGLFSGWEQVNIELYSTVLWVIVYQEIDEGPLLEVLEAVKSYASEWQLQHIYIQRRFQSGNPVQVFMGDDAMLECDFTVQEAGLNYWVNLGKNQNSGLFLDMSEGRAWLRKHSEHKSVLNLFSYTCSLGLSAAAGSAKSVLNVDMAKAAIRRGQQNLSLNDLGGSRVSFIAQDIFKMVKKINQKGPFDILIADPPSFQTREFDVRRDYLKLLQKFKPSMASDATLMLCLNSPALGVEFVISLVAQVWPNAQLVERLDNPKVLADINEDASLKVLIFQLRDGTA